MRVLLMGAPGPTTEEAATRLATAGHDVVRCSDAGEPAFPCKALTTLCPLDEGAIDAALVVRNHSWPRPTVFDRGVTCAVRQRVPVVLAGAVTLNPYEEWADEIVDRSGDVVGAVERVAASAPRHEEIASAALREGLEGAGIAAPEARAEVRRAEGWLRVRLVTPEGMDRAVEQAAARRVIGALREFDRHARGIDVDLATGRGGYTWTRAR